MRSSNTFRRVTKGVPAALIAMTIVACGSGNESLDPNSSGGDGADFTSECGAVVNGTLANPVNTADGQQLLAGDVIRSNVIAIDTGSGPQLVKLHALSLASSANEERARSVLSTLLSGGGYYFPAGAGCVYSDPDGGVGTVGQFFTGQGQSFTEELIKAGYSGAIESSGACNESLIAPCLSALRASVEAAKPQTIGTVRWFLWKPESDGGYNPGLLSILIDPCNVRVYVNGVELADYGPTNGRCTTARSVTTDGCGFGSNARVEVVDASTGIPYAFPDGNPYYIIPNGCSRVEYRI